MNRIFLLIILFLPLLVKAQPVSKKYSGNETVFSGHRIVLDSAGKLLPWYSAPGKAYDAFLHSRWNFIKSGIAPAADTGVLSRYPQYYFYCAYFLKGDTLKPDSWMNDVGEKIPNWFESARLYYGYSGDSTPLSIVRKLIDYHMERGIAPASFSWAFIPFANANAGDTVFNGFTSASRFEQYETQVDHSAEIALTWLQLYLSNGEEKYLVAARRVADLLAAKLRTGSKNQSPWPYLVNAKTGRSRSEYGANWTGAYVLFEKMIALKQGDRSRYEKVLRTLKDFLLAFPLKTGYWTDGHSDTYVNSSSYRSNLSASNFKLFLFDHPDFDKNWKKDLPQLLDWTEKYFVDRSAPGETGRLWGAYIVGEQDSFLYKMDYQTARYAAECARWYAVSNDKRFKEKAFRSLNFVTYCGDSSGVANESPLSNGISNWWSDCYGEGPRMFYQAFAGIPEWSPPGENHLLYSTAIISVISYHPSSVQYQSRERNGIEYLHLNFRPASVLINGQALGKSANASGQFFEIRQLRNGDYFLKIYRKRAGLVVVRDK